MIYFVQSGDDGPIKIGYIRNERSISRRLGGLQVGNPETLHLLAVAEGGPGLEKQLLAAFSRDRIRGEWFKWSDVMSRVIDAYQKDPKRDLFGMGFEANQPKKVSRRKLQKNSAKIGFERQLSDGSMTVRYDPTVLR